MEANDQAGSPAFDERALDQTEHSTRLRVDHPGELIAAIPAMLGFFPTRSLVVALLSTDPLSTGTETIEGVIRFDIDTATDRHLARQVADLVDTICRRENLASPMLIAVDDRATAATTAVDAMFLLREAGLEPRQAWWVDRISTGAEYHDLLRLGRVGRVADPRTSTVALAHVLNGRQIYGSRTELEDFLAPNPALTTQVRPLIEPAATKYRDDLAAATSAGRAFPHRREATGWVLAQIGITDQTPHAARDLARIVALLRDRTIRDIMYSLAATRWHGEAEALWRQIASVTDGSDHAEAATLFGYSAYYRDNTVLAAIAIGAALQADPDHTMAQLFEVSLSGGIRPDRIRRIADAGAEIASDLGIDTTD
ncbi:DUF4192 domain-containing protein [Nocardia ignorata]|uniref:DUF4192 domain-containing protein n=1 Tax=Nocardia ignorata TaxID=145285 RepID=UPI00362DF3D8